MQIQIFKNYGVLGAEKRNVYTFGGEHEKAVCSDKLTVEVPKGWKLFENTFGQTMITAPWGWSYGIDEILGGNEHPCFIAIDKNGDEHRQRLAVVAPKEG